MGRRLSPWYEHVILVSGYPVFWQPSIDPNLDVQYQLESVSFHFGCLPPGRTDGRTDGRSRDFQNFSDR